MLVYTLATFNVALTLAVLLLARHQHRVLTTLHTRLTIAEYRASHDDLTGLLNRRAILAHLQTQLDASRPVTIAVLDFDDFKAINDNHGHDAGDKALIEAARQLKALPMTAGRLGGDEFLMVTTADPRTGSAHAVAAQAAIASACIDAAGRTVRLAVTAGVAHAPAGISLPDLMRRADRAMYAAKRTGEPLQTYHDEIPDVPAPGPQHHRRTYRR
ncbi:GGDEF domain-containing protein [Micromonospora sp. STR1_7]|uniref:GGDEF domain-containing protein n=1 Tax=Micromonospora parastrephiae TaxID=2806101 RepID=A0ABS1XMM1_9ACTN|nr:GGDEF domain-containing protein [Micromonospora parastrephiae]MBM0230516.1 GGDEF domain-containing protein [Micromonospora parastrephiae]